MAKFTKSHANEFIRFGMLALALTVFFIGPRFVQSDIADDVTDTISEFKTYKTPAKIAAPVIRQLNECAAFAKENSGSIALMGVRMSAVNWIALLILVSGLFTPVILKYLDAKKSGAA